MRLSEMDIKELCFSAANDARSLTLLPSEVFELLDRLEAAKTAWKEADKACRDLTEKVIPNLRESLEARVMGAQPAPEVLSDLTSLLREATDILKWYGNGLHIKRLSGRIDWDAERAKLSRENFEYSFEAYDGTEYYVEDGSRAYQLVDKLENALDLAGNINNAQPAPSVPDELICMPRTLETTLDEHSCWEAYAKGWNDCREHGFAAAPEAKP